MKWGRVELTRIGPIVTKIKVSKIDNIKKCQQLRKGLDTVESLSAGAAWESRS